MEFNKTTLNEKITSKPEEVIEFEKIANECAVLYAKKKC